MARRQGDASSLRFAGGAALVGRFQPVIGGVADHMGQRVADQLHHLPVQLGLLTGHVQFDALAEFLFKVAHQTRQLGPGAADRLHPRDHDLFLDLAGHLIEAMQRGLEGAFGFQAQGLDHLVADQHQFADRAHQLFQHLDVDADGGGGLAGARRLRGVVAWRRRSRHGRLCDAQGARAQVRYVLGHGAEGVQRHGDGGEQGVLHPVFQTDVGDVLQRAGQGRGVAAARRAQQALQQGGLQQDGVGVAEQGFERGQPHQRRRGGFGGGVERGVAAETLDQGGGAGGGGGGCRRRGDTGRFQTGDQGRILTRRLLAGGVKGVDQTADHVHGFEDGGDGGGADRQRAVAKTAQHLFRRMGDALQPQQADKAAGALDGVHQAEDAGQGLGIVRIAFETHEFAIQGLEALACFRDEVAQNLVHSLSLISAAAVPTEG